MVDEPGPNPPSPEPAALWSAVSLDSLASRLREEGGPAPLDVTAWVKAARAARRRRPAQVLYGGAKRFSAETPAKLGRLARRALEENLPDAGALAERMGLQAADPVLEEVHQRMGKKLADEPVEDLRIDFEDGLGTVTEEQERAEAVRCGRALAKVPEDERPPFFGLRIRPLRGASGQRALSTLERFCAAWLDAGGRGALTVTLPKVEADVEVALLGDALDQLEAAGQGALRFVVEVMVESPRGLVRDGRLIVQPLLEAGRGRVESVHLGTYDYTSALGVSPPYQTGDHPAVELARQLLLLDLAGTSAVLCDGASHRLPLPVHKKPPAELTADERAANRAAIDAGLREHAASIERALAAGIGRGWDLHPAQLLARYGALFCFYRREAEELGRRLAGYLERAGEGARTGAEWDDAASAGALLEHFLAGADCGALDEAELAAAGVPGA